MTETSKPKARFINRNLNSFHRTPRPKNNDRTGSMHNSSNRMLVLQKSNRNACGLALKSVSITAPAPINTPSLRKENEGKDGTVIAPITKCAGWGTNDDKTVNTGTPYGLNQPKPIEKAQVNKQLDSQSSVSLSKDNNGETKSSVVQDRNEGSDRSTQSVESSSSASPSQPVSAFVKSTGRWGDDTVEEDIAECIGRERAKAARESLLDSGSNENRGNHGLGLDSDAQKVAHASEIAESETKKHNFHEQRMDTCRNSWRTSIQEERITHTESNDRAFYYDHSYSNSQPSLADRGMRMQSLAALPAHPFESQDYRNFSERTDYNVHANGYSQWKPSFPPTERRIDGSRYLEQTYQSAHMSNAPLHDHPTRYSDLNPHKAFHEPDSPSSYVKRVYSQRRDNCDENQRMDPRCNSPWQGAGQASLYTPWVDPDTQRRGLFRRQSDSRERSYMVSNESAPRSLESRSEDSHRPLLPIEKDTNNALRILKRPEQKMLYDYKSGTMVAVKDTAPLSKPARSKIAKPERVKNKELNVLQRKTKPESSDLAQDQTEMTRAFVKSESPSISKPLNKRASLVVKSQKKKKLIVAYRPIIKNIAAEEAAQARNESETITKAPQAQRDTCSEKKKSLTRRSNARGPSFAPKKPRDIKPLEKAAHSAAQPDLSKPITKSQVTKDTSPLIPAIDHSIPSYTPKNRFGIDVELLKKLPEGGGVVVLTEAQKGIVFSPDDERNKFSTVKSRRTLLLERKLKREANNSHVIGQFSSKKFGARANFVAGSRNKQVSRVSSQDISIPSVPDPANAPKTPTRSPNSDVPSRNKKAFKKRDEKAPNTLKQPPIKPDTASGKLVEPDLIQRSEKKPIRNAKERSEECMETAPPHKNARLEKKRQNANSNSWRSAEKPPLRKDKKNAKKEKSATRAKIASHAPESDLTHPPIRSDSLIPKSDSDRDRNASGKAIPKMKKDMQGKRKGVEKRQKQIYIVKSSVSPS